MADSPTEGLLRTLQRLRLCTAADLRRCAPLVQRLTRDLPAFDSAWIDALQRSGRITLFQAKHLDVGEYDRLEVGPCVLVDRLGPQRTGSTFVARHRDSSETCVLKRIEATPDEFDGVLRRLRDLVARGNRAGADGAAGRLAGVVVPERCLDHEGSIVCLAPWIDGPGLDELLVRRGRMPAAVVLSIARQLAEGLAGLERRGFVHGDLRAANVRVDRSGRAHAVDAGIGPAIAASLVVREDRPDRFDGTAPELIGTGRIVDTASDVYAFGCLLWMLLAGRPPFPTGAVLSKLASHRNRDLPPIEDVAPDTPRLLVDVISRTTARSLDLRPGSFEPVSAALGRASLRDRSILLAYRNSLQRSVPRLPTTGTSPMPVGRLAVAAVLLGLCGTVALHDGLRSGLGEATTNAIATTRAWFSGGDPQVVGNERPAGEPADALLPLPEPDEEGVVTLEPGRYRASELAVVGPLVLRGTANSGPDAGRSTIVVDEEALVVWAEELRIENVDVVSTGRDVAALLLARCQTLNVIGSRFDTTPPVASESQPPAATESDPTPGGARYGLAWKPVDERDARGLGVDLENVVFSGDRTAMYLSNAPRQLGVRNTLKTGAGSLLEFATTPESGADTTLVLDRVTIRETNRLLTCRRSNRETGVLWIEANDCVFDLEGSDAALIAWSRATEARADRVQFEGLGSVSTPGVPIAIVLDEAGRSRDVSDDPNVILEGLTANRAEFAGPIDDPAGSVVQRLDGPRIGGGRPGIDPGRLLGPVPRSTRLAN